MHIRQAQAKAKGSKYPRIVPHNKANGWIGRTRERVEYRKKRKVTQLRSLLSTILNWSDTLYNVSMVG